MLAGAWAAQAVHAAAKLGIADLLADGPRCDSAPKWASVTDQKRPAGASSDKTSWTTRPGSSGSLHQRLM
jgi:hypothetical protein